MVGVPLIVPFAVFKDKPAGSVGETDQDAIVPPLAVGVTSHCSSLCQGE